MPLPPRHDQKGAGHHAFPRGNRGQDIFRDNADRQVFLVILKAVVDAYGWDLRAYCLMRNHVHIVVITPEANFSAGMQRLLSTYAQYFNYRHDLNGHVFRRPFRSVPARDEQQFEVAVHYAANNPVRAGLCEDLREWRWSSHGAVPDAHRDALMGPRPDSVPPCVKFTKNA